jgi:hypothetical protein
MLKAFIDVHSAPPEIDQNGKWCKPVDGEVTNKLASEEF